MDKYQTDAANEVAKGAVELYRDEKRRAWKEEQDALPENTPKGPDPAFMADDAPDSTIETALRATIAKAMEDAFNGIANPANPGDSQRLAADGAITGAGLTRDPQLGHLVGIEPAPLPLTTTTEYPKWVTPHDSHVKKAEDGRVITVAGFNDSHIARDGSVTVLVDSEEDEQRASNEYREPCEDSDATDAVDGSPEPAFDPTGAKTVYPAEDVGAEHADPAGITEDAAKLNETPEAKTGAAADATPEELASRKNQMPPPKPQPNETGQQAK